MNEHVMVELMTVLLRLSLCICLREQSLDDLVDRRRRSDGLGKEARQRRGKRASIVVFVARGNTANTKKWRKKNRRRVPEKSRTSSIERLCSSIELNTNGGGPIKLIFAFEFMK